MADIHDAAKMGLFYAVLDCAAADFNALQANAQLVREAIDAALADLDKFLTLDREVWHTSWVMQVWSATNARDGLEVRVRWLAHGAWQGAFKASCFGREDWLYTRDCSYPTDAARAAFESLRIHAVERRLLAEKIEGVAAGVVDQVWEVSRG